jgi:hypothetical protein
MQTTAGIVMAALRRNVPRKLFKVLILMRRDPADKCFAL